MKIPILCAVTLLSALFSAHGADSENTAVLADWTLGTTVSGEELRMDDLSGKAVVIEYWGTR